MRVAGPFVLFVLLSAGGVVIAVRVVTAVVAVDDVLATADRILVLNGRIDQRARRAAEVYQRGLATRILIAQSRERFAGRRPGELTLSDSIAATIVGHGVPPEHVEIIPFPHGVVTTRDEAHAFRTYVDRHPIGSVIVVTSEYHTGRARLLLRQALTGRPVDVRVASAGAPAAMTAAAWWRSREGIRVYATEFLKQVAARLPHPLRR